MALTENERADLKRDILDMRAEEKQCLEKSAEIMDRVRTMIDQANLMTKRAGHLNRMARDNAVLIWGRDTFLGRLKARYMEWKERRADDDGYPGI